jgi:hypothetical protein
MRLRVSGGYTDRHQNQIARNVPGERLRQNETSRIAITADKSKPQSEPDVSMVDGRSG